MVVTTTAYKEDGPDYGVQSRNDFDEPPRPVNKGNGGLDFDRQESFEDLQRLLEDNHPPVPKGWDYLCLPRRVNLKRVQEPMVEILADYFEPVRQIQYPLAPKGIIYVLGLAMLSLAFSLMSVMVYRWGEYTVWLVLGLGKSNLFSLNTMIYEWICGHLSLDVFVD